MHSQRSQVKAKSSNIEHSRSRMYCDKLSRCGGAAALLGARPAVADAAAQPAAAGGRTRGGKRLARRREAGGCWRFCGAAASPRYA